MTRTGWTPAAAACGALLLAACGDADRVTTPVAPVASAHALVEARPAALEEVTRLLALALADQGLRSRVKSDMRKAPYSEHKLQFGDYLRGQSGGILLAKMAREGGSGREAVLALLADLPPLEFYMPVAAHRETWTGGPDLIVAASISDEGAAPIGFDLRGRPLVLSADQPPATPTLVLVPVETDFSRALDPKKARNVRDRDGDAIGTLMMVEPVTDEQYYSCTDPYALQCDGGGGGGGSTTPTPSTVQQRGISVEEFITHMKTPNDHEPWTQGAPEFYLLLAGKYGTGIDFKNRINIPEGPWSGSDDDNNSKWRNFGALSLMLWDVDLGTRVTVQCMEDDFDWETTQTVGGSTEFPDRLEPGGFPLKLNYSIAFKVGWGDDECGGSFINMRNTQGAWYHIPDGVNDDLYNPVIPYYDGTSDLHWYGYGLPRI